MSEKTPDDRKHDKQLLLYGFILTTIVGGLITFLFHFLEANAQAKAAARTEQAKLIEARREQATELFKDVSQVLDTRLYKWRQVAWGLEDKVAEPELQRRYADYRATLQDWVYNLNRRRALTCRFFGPAAGNRFELQITPEFIRLHKMVAEITRSPASKRPTYKPNKLNEQADELNRRIYLFNNSLAEAIRSGNVGSTDPGNSCDLQANHPNLHTIDDSIIP